MIQVVINKTVIIIIKTIIMVNVLNLNIHNYINLTLNLNFIHRILITCKHNQNYQITLKINHIIIP
jgi:spore coat protein U-like protein